MKKEMMTVAVGTEYIDKVTGVNNELVSIVLPTDALKVDENFCLETKFNSLNGKYIVRRSRFCKHLGKMGMLYECVKVKEDEVK